MTESQQHEEEDPSPRQIHSVVAQFIKQQDIMIKLMEKMLQRQVMMKMLQQMYN